VLSVRVEFSRESPVLQAERINHARDAMAAATRREAALHELGQRIASIAGVEGVAFDDDIVIGNDANESITIPGRPTDSLGTGQLYVSSATPGFLELMHVPLRRGRHLTRADAAVKIRALWHPVTTDMPLAEKEARAIPEPVVVNEAFVQRFFPGVDPVGMRFCIDPTNKTYWFVIVGVVADMRRQGLDRRAIPEYFETFLPMSNAELLVRTRGDPVAVAPTVRQIIASALPGTIVSAVTTVDRKIGDFSAQRRFQTWLLAIFAALALVLAAIGIYGVVHYAVAERTREIGVRIALGAATADVLRMVISQGMRLPLLGIGIGIVAALGLTRVMSHLLFDTAPTDPVTFAGVAVLLAGVAFVACYLPARRATRVDPVTALRQE
jgi:predicted permease